MEIMLTQLATGTCKNCGKPVSLLFDGHEQEWVHDDGEHRMERYCADSPKAEPVEDAIERVKTAFKDQHFEHGRTDEPMGVPIL